MASGTPLATWCRSSNTARSTVSGWEVNPQFKRDVDRVRRTMTDRAIGRLTASLESMADGMVELGKNAESEQVRLAAQKSVITHLHEMSDHAEFKERLEMIERQLEHLDDERKTHARRFA